MNDRYHIYIMVIYSLHFMVFRITALFKKHIYIDLLGPSALVQVSDPVKQN